MDATEDFNDKNIINKSLIFKVRNLKGLIAFLKELNWFFKGLNCIVFIVLGTFFVIKEKNNSNWKTGFPIKISKFRLEF